jgi:hypothetical protein
MNISTIKTSLLVVLITLSSNAFSQGNLTFFGASIYTSNFGLNATTTKVLIDTITIPAGFVFKIENDNAAGLFGTAGNLNVSAPLFPHRYDGVVEILNVANGNRIINSKWFGGQAEKSYPLWLNAGTYHIFWHNPNGWTTGSQTTVFFRYTLHGLLFSIN